MSQISDFISSKVQDIKSRILGGAQQFGNATMTQIPFTPQFNQQASNFGNAIQSGVNYFNPSSNSGQNFWSTPVAQGLANIQQSPTFKAIEPTARVVTDTTSNALKAGWNLQGGPQIVAGLQGKPIPPMKFGQGLQDIGAGIKGAGMLTVGVPAQATGGAINVGLGALQDRGFQNAPQRFAEGVGSTQQLGPLEAAASALTPFRSMLKPQSYEVIKAMVQRGEPSLQVAKEIVKNIGEKALSESLGMGAYGATMPAQNLVDRVKNVLEQGAQGAIFSGGIGALGLGGSALKDAWNSSAVKPGFRLGRFNIHWQDANEMSDFIDYTRKTGNNVPRADRYKYEGEMRQLAEHYGINPNQSNTKLANSFDKVLQEINFGKTANINFRQGAINPEPQPESAISQIRKGQNPIPQELQPLAEEARKYKSAEEIIKNVSQSSTLPFGRGVQGRPITKEEVSSLANHFRHLETPENKKWFGKIVKTWTGDEDVVLGVTKNKNTGSREYVVMSLGNKHPEYKGVMRVHSTPLSEKDIVGDFYNQATQGVPEGGGGVNQSTNIPLGGKTINPVSPSQTPEKTLSQGQAEVPSKIPMSTFPSDTIITKQSPEGAIKDFEDNVLNSKVKLPKLDITSQNIKTATTKSVLELNSVKQAFADWVNARKASTVEGLLKGQEFSNLDSRGINGIFDFQAGNKTGELAGVQKYFDTKYALLQEKGIDFNYKKDYLPQLWANTGDQINQVFGRNLTKRPGFTLESLIKNYQEGIDAGLTPRFQKISDLVNWYEKTANKSIADNNFFKYLVDESMVLPPNKAPKDWVTLNPDGFPRYNVRIEGALRNKEYSGVYKAPSELGKMINNYLAAPEGNLAKVADYVSAVKNRALSFGIPGTGINAHGFNILARHTLFGSGGNPLTRFVEGANFITRPNEAAKLLESSLKNAPEAVHNGLTFSIEDHKVLTEDPGLMSKFGQKWNDLFEKPLFDKMLPALKLQSYEALRKDLAKNLSQEEAGKSAAKITNDIYGGINWEELGKSKDYNNLKRALLLAPDWLQTQVNTGANISKNLFQKGPVADQYRRMATNILGAFTMLNVANKLTSGHWMWENDPGHTFELESGYTPDGQKRYIRPFGTALDFVRIPFDSVIALSKGNLDQGIFRPLRNRLSIPMGVAVGAITDTDYRGNPIGYKGTNKYGKEIPTQQRVAGVGGELLQLAGVPAFGKQFLDTATGKQGLEQGLTQGFELPFRYAGGSFSPADKKVSDALGLKGKDQYDLSKQLKTQAPFSDKQVESIKTGGQTVLSDIINKRASDKEVANASKEISQQQSGEKQVGTKVVFWNPIKGKTQELDLNMNFPKPSLTGDKLTDQKLNSRYNSSITSRQSAILDYLEAGKTTKEEASKIINNLEKMKIRSSGSKKMSKPKVGVSSKKIAKIKILKIKKVKVKSFKPIKFITRKPTKLKIKV